jgi:hypothetical protein
VVFNGLTTVLFAFYRTFAKVIGTFPTWQTKNRK